MSIASTDNEQVPDRPDHKQRTDDGHGASSRLCYPGLPRVCTQRGTLKLVVVWVATLLQMLFFRQVAMADMNQLSAGYLLHE